MKSIHFWFPWILSLSSTNLTIFSPYHWLSTLNPPCRQRLLLCRRRLEHFAGQVRSTQQFECAIVQACRDVPGWMSASPAAVECCWVCAPVPRYFAQAQPNETFVVCRLSSVALIATHLSFAKARQGREAVEAMPRGDGVCLNAWAIVGSHKCRLRAQGRGRGVQRGHGDWDCRLHRLPQHNHLCLFAWRCDLAAPWACLYLNFWSAHTWNSSCARECWSCAQRLSYELMVPKVTQVINSFCSRTALLSCPSPCLCLASYSSSLTSSCVDNLAWMELTQSWAGLRYLLFGNRDLIAIGALRLLRFRLVPSIDR